MATYGIDLGTTKSVIGIGDKLSASIPSVANLQMDRAGVSQYDNYSTWKDENGITHPSTIRNYKVDMQTSNDGSGAVASSACVLRELKRVMNLDPDTPIDAVISVPAYFSVDQCLATRKAAEYANINVKSLIKEPTAAALHLHGDKDGLIAVFDLGGGTFDVSILSMSNGKATVLATDGCILGGRDFDLALGKMLQSKNVVSVLNATDEYYAWVKRLKERACNNRRDTPSSLQFPSTIITNCPNNVVQLDMHDYERVQSEVFKRTIDITRSAFKMAGVRPEDVSFYFVGGSCMCTYLRERVEKALGITAVPTYKYDMNKAVARGAVYYAALIDEGVAANFMQDASKILSMCVDDAPLLKTLVYKNTGMPARVTQAYSLSECAMRNELKQSYEVKIFYGDCPVNTEFWNATRDADNQVEDNNQLVKTVVIHFDNEVACNEDTIVIVDSLLMGDGHLKISIKVPMQEAIIIDEVIIL